MENNIEFKCGDVVKLKSGSPKMTIEEIGKYAYSDEDKAKCIWFDGTKKFEDVISFHSLVKVED